MHHTQDRCWTYYWSVALDSVLTKMRQIDEVLWMGTWRHWPSRTGSGRLPYNTFFKRDVFSVTFVQRKTCFDWFYKSDRERKYHNSTPYYKFASLFVRSWTGTRGQHQCQGLGLEEEIKKISSNLLKCLPNMIHYWKEITSPPPKKSLFTLGQ